MTRFGCRPIAWALIAPALCAAVAVLGVSGPAGAAPHAYVSVLSPADRALAHRAAAYLQTLKSVKARFSQTDARGQVTTGTLYLQRPGKARFQYNPPTGLLVVADGINVSVYDERLKSFDQYPLAQTPLSLLLGDKVAFGKGVIVGPVTTTPGAFAVIVRDAAKAADGSLTLSFAAKPIALKGWTVMDAQGHRTEVRISDLAPAGALSPSLFVLKDPRTKAFRP